AWISPEAAHPEVRAVLAAYAAAARRDAVAMEEAGLAALAALGHDRPLAVREHMLVTAILGALARDDLERAVEIERQFGAEVEAGALYGFIRYYLLAWIDVQRQKAGQGG